jgi:uncharacterized protein (DUF934 family)
MPLLKNGEIVHDPWVAAGDDTSLPFNAPTIISFAHWQAERARVEGANVRLGLRLRNTDPVEALRGSVARFDLIALEFPKFTDGRAYSQARLLRERLGFAGELRATGHVLPDQLLFMQRCGFDAFELAKGAPIEAWKRAIESFSVFYQPAADGREPVNALRRVLGSRA